MVLEVLPFSVLSGKENMELDEHLAFRSRSEGKFFFRWYGWKELTLSFGYSQKELMERFETDLPKVLRPTGGGILLHGWDLSFAFTTPEGYFKSPLQLYQFVSEIFLKTFKRLGVGEVTYSRRRRGNYLRKELCQFFPTFGEVMYQDRKLVSSAVREFKRGNYLIHGSIYIAYNSLLAGKYLKAHPKILKNSLISLADLKIKKNSLKGSFLEILEKSLKTPGNTH